MTTRYFRLGTLRLLLILASSDCLAETAENDLTTEAKQGSQPTVGVEATESPGNPFYRVWDYREVTRLVSGGSYAGSPGWGRPPITEGEPLYQLQKKGKTVYCQEKACLEDTDGDGTLDLYMVNRAFGFGAKKEIDPIILEKSTSLLSGGFVRELVYQGMNSGVLRLAYREYSDSLARPSFSQDLTYSAESFPIDVAFKDAIITVLDANNVRIRYVVTKGW